MSWQGPTERQVGAAGIADVRSLLAAARTDAARARRQRSVLLAALLTVALALSMTVASSGPSSAAPLPPGTYSATVPGGTVRLTVHPDGDVDLDAPATLSVELARDEQGRVLDTFTVTGSRTWSVQVEVDAAGGHRIVVRPAPGDRGPSLDLPTGEVGTSPTTPSGPVGPTGGATAPTEPGDRADDRRTDDEAGGGAGDPGDVLDDVPGRETGPAAGGSADAPGIPDAPDGSGPRATIPPGRPEDPPGRPEEPPGRTGDPGRAEEAPGRIRPGGADG